jgi:uridine kinase
MPVLGSLGEPAARQVISAVAGWRAGHRAHVLVIAIDGHGSAGKSTIAAAVAEAIGATLVHTDDFFDPAAPREPGLSGYYDWRRLRAEALEPLRAGRAAQFRRFDWARGRGLDGMVCLTPGPLIAVEGVFSASPELSDLVDRSVFVDTPEPERLRRLRAQTTPSEWDDEWLKAEQAYFGLIRPPPSFDLIVSGSLRKVAGRLTREPSGG